MKDDKPLFRAVAQTPRGKASIGITDDKKAFINWAEANGYRTDFIHFEEMDFPKEYN